MVLNYASPLLIFSRTNDNLQVVIHVIIECSSMESIQIKEIIKFINVSDLFVDFE